MERGTDDGEGSPRIDVRTLPESVAALWETMLRLDPSWDLAKWLDERAKDELGLVESHLGREKLRVEQRLHRIETLVKRLKRQREVQGTKMSDPHQKNLFDVFGSGSGVTKTDELEVEFEGEQAAVDFGSMDVGDDPLLAIVSEHVLGILEVARLAGLVPCTIGAEMLESDGDGALSLEGAREYADRYGIPMITGEQVSTAFDEKD